MARSLRQEEVNKRHSYTWTRCNDDAKSKVWRERYMTEFGGNFTKIGRYFEWKPVLKAKEPTNRKIIVIKPDGTEDLVQNFTKYCRDNDLSKSAMYEVMSGKRSQHKGFRATREELT